MKIQVIHPESALGLLFERIKNMKLVRSVIADVKKHPDIARRLVFFVIFFFIVYPLFLRP